MDHRGWFPLLLLILLCSCASRSELKTPPPPGLLGGLPALDAITRIASFDDTSQVRYGMEFDLALPHREVHPTIGSVNTATFRTEAGPPLEPAWAIYTFDLTGYDESPELNFTWYSTPDDQSVWVALANWSEQRWEFIAVDPVHVDLASLTPYLDPNNRLAVAIVVTGDEWRYLRWFSVGQASAPAPPNIFGVFPTSGQPDAPYTVSAQVTGSLPLTYAWDFGAGATPGQVGGATPTVTMGPAGDYDCTLTLSNKYGSAQYDFQIHSVVPTWSTHLIGNEVNNRFVALDTTWQDHVFAAAEMDNQRISVFEFNGVGDLLWNRAYTGLPANKVTKLLMTDPEINNGESEIRDFVLCCYQDNGGTPGNAYVLSCNPDGSVKWCTLLGQGIPDIDLVTNERICFALDMPDLHSRFGMLNSNGAVEWAYDTEQQAEYTACAAGLYDLNEGIYYIGQQFGHLAIARLSVDGLLQWAYTYDFDGTTIDAAALPGTGVVITGQLPLDASQQREAYYMAVRLDGFVFGYTKFTTHPCIPRSLSSYYNVVFMTASAPVPDETRLYMLDAWGLLYRGYRIEAAGGVDGGMCKLTRFRPSIPGELEPPLQPSEALVFVGNATTVDMSQFSGNLERESWQPFPESFIPLNLVSATLPQESLDITPEEITYTIDAPAGERDALFMRIEGAF